MTRKYNKLMCVYVYTTPSMCLVGCSVVEIPMILSLYARVLKVYFITLLFEHLHVYARPNIDVYVYILPSTCLNVHSLKHPLIWSTLFLGNGSCLCVNNSNYHAYYIWSLILSPDSRVSIRVHNPFHMSNPNIEISLTPCAMWS